MRVAQRHCGFGMKDTDEGKLKWGDVPLLDHPAESIPANSLHSNHDFNEPQ